MFLTASKSSAPGASAPEFPEDPPGPPLSNPTASEPLWHAVGVDVVVSGLHSTVTGLDTAEAQRRLDEDGPNELRAARRRSSLRSLWEQLTAVMVLILLGAAALSLVLGKAFEAGAIAVIVVLFVLLGFIQEHRAERAIAALQAMAEPTVQVLRDGLEVTRASSELVRGDVVMLQAGNMVPADARLIDTVGLRVEEAALTGESDPIFKQTAALGVAEPPLGDRTNMVYAGTQVTQGRGRAVVTATGMTTELGQIARMLQGVTTAPTPLQDRLDAVGKQLAVVGVVVAALVMIMGALGGEPVADLLLTAISVAVAVIPEGLPAVVTVTLAIGAQRMLRRNALIRKLPAVETLGSVTVICTDKTGTLTQNRMSAAVLDVAGQTQRLDEPIALPLSSAAALALVAGVLCNDGNGRVDHGGDFSTTGDPTETALLVAAHTAGIDIDALRGAAPRVGELPFDADRKRMSTVHDLGGAATAMLPAAIAGCTAFVKGAVGSLVERTVSVWDGEAPVAVTAEWCDRITRAESALAADGMRVLGLAYRTIDDAGADDFAEDQLTFVGLVGIIDPPRPEVRDAIATCTRAGVRTVMITGDHPSTAKAIADDLGIPTDGGVVTGAEFDALDDAGVDHAVRHRSVFARVSPEHKLRIVKSLENQGQVVAMTGDGVNDAPALKQADIGVAMGITGTDVSKDASDMVLRDDNFASIVAAVEEGRVIYDNLRRFVKFAVAGNIGKIIVMIGWPLPFLLAGDGAAAVALLPLQLLWLNLMTDGLLGLSLGVEPPERGVMDRPPHAPGASMWAGGLGRQAVWIGGLIGGAALGIGLTYEARGHENWQTMMFTSLAFLQVFQALGTRSATESLRTLGFRTNPVMMALIGVVVVLQLAAIMTPLRGFLDLDPLSAFDLGVCVGAGVALLAVLEAHKAWVRSRARHERSDVGMMVAR